MSSTKAEPEIVLISAPIKAVGFDTKTGMKTAYRNVAGILSKYDTKKRNRR